MIGKKKCNYKAKQTHYNVDMENCAEGRHVFMIPTHCHCELCEAIKQILVRPLIEANRRKAMVKNATVN